MIKVLVADDERLARKTITLLLNTLPDIDEVYEANNGNQALELAREHQPDVLFLDIQMPGLTGIQVAERLGDQFAVVFVTAYDKYAITAFELNAIDYLLKPFDDSRFFASLRKARQRLVEKQFEDFRHIGQQLRQLMDEDPVHYKDRLVVKDQGRIRLVEVEQINYIVGAGNYAEVHLLDGKSLLHRETLSSLEKQLDPTVFIRIHRSSIVRSSSVSELRPTEKGDYTVLLKQGQMLTLSRRNKHKLAFLLGE